MEIRQPEMQTIKIQQLYVSVAALLKHAATTQAYRPVLC